MRVLFFSAGIVSISSLASVALAGTANYAIPVNFSAGSYSNSGYIPGFAPPDTNGAVGAANIAELINGQFSIYNKIASGTADTPVLSETLKTFWKNALSSSAYSAAFTPSGSTTTVGLSDPRIIYDPSSGDWFASSITVPENGTGVSASNDFLVAESGNPLLGWHGITYNSLPTGMSNEFADFPTLGITANYVTLAGNMYSVPSALNNFTSSPTNTDVLVIPKASLTAGNATGAALFNQPYSNLGFTNQPVSDLGGNAGHSTYLYSNYQQNSGNSVGYTENLNQTVVVPGSPPSLDINFNLATFATQTGAPPAAGASQPGSSNAIDTGDDRLSSSLVLSNGQIWGVQTITNPGNSNISALRVFGVTPTSTDGASPTIRNELVLTDPNNPGSSLYYGSLAVGTNGTVVLAFNESSGSQYVSSYAVVGHISNTGNLSLGTPFLLKAGTADYTLLTGSYRWGDYSTTVADPTNPNAFWTFQELPAANGTWSTQVTEILTPEPASLALLAGGGIMLLRKRRSARPNRV